MSTRKNLMVCGALLLLTLSVYWPTIYFDFVNYDDGDYVTGNDHVQSGLNEESIKWAFTTGHASNWHPLTWLSHELDCRIYGMKAGGAHLTNLLFHCANTLLLFWLLWKMTGATLRSALVAALFALHPTHVESVAWISERKDVLSTFFWLLTMLAYVKSTNAQCPRPKVFYLLALLFFALGLMSKPMLVTLPFVLLLMDYWPLNRIYDLRFTIHDLKEGEALRFRSAPLSGAILDKIPFLVLAAASSIVTFIVQRKGGSVVGLNAMPAGARFANALVSYLRYVGKLIWPENLSVLYPMPPSWPLVLIAAAALFVAGISAVAVWQAKRRPYLFVGWFWFLGTLVPVIGLVQVGVQSMADRYLYVPAIGLFIAATWGVTELAAHWPKKCAVPAVAAVMVLGACWLATLAQVQYWRNGETLFRHAIKATRNNYLAYNNLGVFLENHGKPDEASDYYRRSVEINPMYEEARNNLGHILTTQGKYGEAIIHLQEALKIKPGLVEAHNNLGNLLVDLGKQKEGIEQYELALHYKTNDADAHNNLGIALAMQGKLDEAEKLLREAVRLKPSDGGAHGNLGNVLALRNKSEEAMREYQKSFELDPNNSQTSFNMGNVLLGQGKFEEAAARYATAIKLKPNNPDAEYKLGLALGAEGKREEAARHFREALRLDPNQLEAKRRLRELLGGK